MKKFLTICLSALALVSSDKVFSQTQSDTVKVTSPESASNNKEEKNRNVMLNAENNSGPRSVNFGLPFGGDIVILENDVPVVYYYYPTIPTAAWRRDNSLSKMGLLSFAEGALVFGKVGFAVQSADRDASSSFKGFASVYGNSFGSSRYDVTLTGPIGKKGWGYMASAYENFDRGNGINYMYTPWNDRTQMFKFALQKKYKKGNVRVLYKYVDAKLILNNYMPVTYLGNGKTKQLDNFELGKDSYILRNGLLPYYDAYTGSPAFADLDENKFNQSLSNSLYLTGNHKFTNGWNLTYTSMWQKMKTPFSVAFPLSLSIVDPDQYNGTSYTYQGTNKPYTGSVQTIINSVIPQADNTTLITRAELTKKLSLHDLRIGITQQYNHRSLVANAGTYLQTVEANPQQLDLYNAAGVKQTNDFGLRGAGFGGYGSITNDTYKKVALYVSDDWNITKWLDLSLGARLEHQNKRDKKYMLSNKFFNDPANQLLSHDFNNKWNKVGVASTVVKLSSEFGLVADYSYNSWFDSYWDYPYKTDIGSPAVDPATGLISSTLPKDLETKVINYGGGVYFNHGTQFSVVSKITRISKQNNKYNNATITDPVTFQRFSFDPIFYDIGTIGWSTDIVATPFKNFTIHYLLTLQKPEYENFKYGAFGVEYEYSNNIIPELSQTLMEIDPSYSFMNGQLRAWMSVRYFGKQMANPTNAFFYNARWENFGGLDYRMSRNVDFKLQVTNFLDQKGVKGAVQGADQITNSTPYEGRKVAAGSIRPRTIELTANFKF